MYPIQATGLGGLDDIYDVGRVELLRSPRPSALEARGEIDGAGRRLWP